MAESWGGDATLLAHVAPHQCGTVVVEGKRTSVFQRSDGRRVTGPALLTRAAWPGRARRQRPGLPYGRRTATRPTYGVVTVVSVKAPGEACSARRGQATPLTAPRLLRAWTRRRWMAHDCRTLQQLLATDACQGHGEEAYDGHLGWRLVAALGLLDPARRLLNGRVTREAIVCSLPHHWRFLTSKDLA